MKRAFILLITVLSFNILLHSFSTNEEVFQRGVNAYEERNYELALTSFLHLIEEGIINAELYYNTGNTFFRLDNLGAAILYYKKGLRLEPHNQLLRKNLNYLLSLTQDRQLTEETNPFLKIMRQFVYSLPLNSLFLLTLICFALLIFIVNVIIIFYHKKDKTIPLFILSFMMIIFIMTGSVLYYRWHKFTDDSEAVLLASAATGYSGPAEDYTTLFRIHEGMIFRVEMSGPEWSRVKLPTGITGWIKNETFQRVKF